MFNATEKILKFYFLKTDDQEAFVQPEEVLELFDGQKTRKEVHDAVISMFEVRFVQHPGNQKRSPRGRYLGLRKRMAAERLEHIKIVISVGTTFEAENLQEILTSREDVMGDDLIDVRQIVTGRSGNLPIAILLPTDRGQMPQYAAMREILNRCPNATHFFKSGGFGGPYDMGDIIVAAEGQNGVLVEDQVLDKVWKRAPGFPGPDLRQAAFEASQPTLSFGYPMTVSLVTLSLSTTLTLALNISVALNIFSLRVSVKE